MTDVEEGAGSDPWAGKVPPLPEEAPEDEQLPKAFVRGGAFVLDVPDTPPAVWGEGGDVLWAEGEALMVAAPQGVGKTTVAHQVVRARLGLQENALGFPVTEGRRVLLLSMDRPAQARRAAHRIFAKDDRDVLDDRLIVWEGPPPFDLATRTDILAAMCERAKADTVVLDSLKDAAIGLSDDAVGAGYNRARQTVLAAGVQVLELHHTRKAGANGGEPNTISDVYGSTWLTSGTGSVISLYGDPGDPIVSFRHLKQPMNEVGPFQLIHDHPSGTTSVMHTVDLVELVRASGPEGLTALAAAEALFETKKPSRADKEKARRRLEALTASSVLARLEPKYPGGSAAYYLAAREQG
ncbi:AAA family ATPase [Streptomyces sp. NBC_00258]|uniref:AAA family ATPase n=1 Tax=Streptomyces sp. NBC_00258 TaxID=2903642 RepID=UPI002E2D3167|nr:AAA family ATPase [Streptomyces sp. NBC_00258]